MYEFQLYIIYTWKKLRDTSSPNFNFLKFELTDALRFWIFDSSRLKALSTYRLNYLSPLNLVLVLSSLITEKEHLKS